MKRRIGIPFWKIGENSFGSTIPYLDFVGKFGEIVPLMPDHTLRDDLDLIILPGGADVDVSKYNQTPSFYTGKPDIFKEHFDRVYLPQYIKAGIPIFAICRAHQSIAAHFNGGLYQHMWHETNTPTEGTKIMHNVELEPIVHRFLPKHYKPVYNKSTKRQQYLIGVNSRHHQTVDERTLAGTGLHVIGRHSVDNHVEFIAHDTLPIVGQQSHPEDIYDYNSMKFTENIIEYLIESRESILK